MFATKSPTSAASEVRGGDLGSRDLIGDVRVGHRMPGGQLRTHAPGMPCGLCDASIYSPRLYRAS